MEQEAAKEVKELMPGCQLTTLSRNLSIRLCLFLDIRDADHYVIQYLMVVMSFNDLKIEKAIISQEFGYPSISHARTHFRWLVLTCIKKEDKELQVDLKPFYLEETNFYNSVVSEMRRCF